MAAAVMNARSSAFAKRSLIFKPAPVAASIVSDWGSPNGKVEWGMQREEMNKMRRSVSFGINENNNNNNNNVSRPEAAFGLNGAAVRDEFKMPLWAEKMYIEHEKQQRVA
ncbi:hypothetical protein Bca52824_049068 [Brassica carinata]|uniref:Uncharacterized protein n=1 Tax=Brassica carinata TaxID=52824 RepID=A0A8X7RPQ8_BRACI|nr:hypothetical protein Bca52824_049068 [Brassica carinata]